VPANPSSPILPALTQLTRAGPLQFQFREAETPHLLAYLATIPTREPPVGAATRSPPSWRWLPRRCWPALGR
jgi:hypothetical protein